MGYRIGKLKMWFVFWGIFFSSSSYFSLDVRGMCLLALEGKVIPCQKHRFESPTCPKFWHHLTIWMYFQHLGSIGDRGTGPQKKVSCSWVLMPGGCHLEILNFIFEFVFSKWSLTDPWSMPLLTGLLTSHYVSPPQGTTLLPPHSWPVTAAVLSALGAWRQVWGRIELEVHVWHTNLRVRCWVPPESVFAPKEYNIKYQIK